MAQKKKPTGAGVLMTRATGLAILALLAWAGWDLGGPRQVDIRTFDPVETARLDNAMWRAYYDRKPLPMYLELAELLRQQFHFPYLRSYLAAASASKAAFVFKYGHTHADYEKALPDLIHYYEAIHRISITPFDVEKTARLELEWWIVHRERIGHPGTELEHALEAAGAALYQVPPAALIPYGKARAAAMAIRDTQAVAGGVTEADWKRIEALLRTSWDALSKAVAPGQAV